MAAIQYYVRHHSVNDFKMGERVFVKSNPEVGMWVVAKDEEKNLIYCTWRNQRSAWLKPEMIIQPSQAWVYSLN